LTEKNGFDSICACQSMERIIVLSYFLGGQSNL